MPEDISIQRLGGQESRPPPTKVEQGKAARSEGAFHHSEALASAMGSVKITKSAIPGPCYELNGIETGPLQLDLPSSYGWWGHYLDTYPNKDHCIGFAFKLSDLGQLSDGIGDSRGALVFSSSNQGLSPFQPNIQDNMAVRFRAVMVTNGAGDVVPGFKFQFGADTTEFWPTDASAGGTDPFDPEDWFWASIHWRWRNATDTVTIDLVLSQLQGDGTTSQATVQFVNAPPDDPETLRWELRRCFFGGRTGPRRHFNAVAHPCRMRVSEVRFARVANSLQPPWGPTGEWVRWDADDLDGVFNVEVFPLTESGSQVLGLAGTRGRLLRGVHRDTDSVAGSTKSLLFDGSNGVFIPNAVRFRAPPDEDVPNYFLERDEICFGVFLGLQDRLWPFSYHRGEDSFDEQPDERACIMCWSTPYTYNQGVPTDPVGASGARPGEHLRVELCMDLNGKDFWFDVYFGELEPESLKHPTGYPGGSQVTTWPPTLAYDKTPAPAWNKPLDLPPNVSSPSFRIEIGSYDFEEDDADHPLNYDWAIFVQKKWVGQGDPGNKMSAYAYKYVDGVLDTTAGDDTDGELHDVTEEKTYTNQSCYTSKGIGVLEMNTSTDSYAFSLGEACPNNYSDELGKDQGLGWEVYESTSRGIFPSKGAPNGFGFSSAMEGYGFVGNMAHFFCLKKYLRRDERDIIFQEGKFGPKSQLAFQGFILSHLPMEESGTILRDYTGSDIDAEDPRARAIYVLELGEYDDPVAILDDGFQSRTSKRYFPNLRESSHNEGPPFVGEASPITAVIQRIDEAGGETVYVTSQTGLYSYDRDSLALTRLVTMPGQGGPYSTSWAMDQNDVIHVVGGPGRPVIITRNNIVAYSGILPPDYSAPTELITQLQGVSGGFGVVFESKGDTDVNNLKLYELTNGSVYGFCVGYYSEILKARSSPGPVIHLRYTDPQASNQINAGKTYRYRARLTGSLPLPTGFNSKLVTHWDIYRTGPNDETPRLEWRIPIGDSQPSIYIGWRPDFELEEEANFFIYPPQRGMKHVSMIGARMIGVGSQNEPRQMSHSLLNDAMSWPPNYRKTLTATSQVATGSATRRDRSFVTSVDALYQLHDELRDTDPQGQLPNPVQLIPIAKGVGSLSGNAIAEVSDDGLFLPGLEGIFATEGGTHRRMSRAVDSDSSEGDSWTWPDSWDTSDPSRFFSVHDERIGAYILFGPAADDSTRIDALYLFYEHVRFTPDGNLIRVPEHTRVKGVDVRCATPVLNPTTKKREIWCGTESGHLIRMNEGHTHTVSYSDQSVSPLYGFVTSFLGTNLVRLAGNYKAYTDDVFVGARMRFYRRADGVSSLVGEGVVTSVSISDSWIDVTLDRAHNAVGDDFWTVGALPMSWRSGELDFGSPLSQIRVSRVDLRFRQNGNG